MTELPDGWTDEDERAWRKEVVREIHRLQDERGLRIDPAVQARWRALLQRFEQGEVAEEEVKSEIIRPYLH